MGKERRKSKVKVETKEVKGGRKEENYINKRTEGEGRGEKK